MPALALLRAAFKRPRPYTDTDTAPTTRLSTTLTPDPAHLSAYNRVCGFDATTDGALPLTYPHVLAFPLAMRLMTARDFPLRLLGLVHTSIEITQHHPLRPGDELQLAVRTTQLAPHRRGTEATLLTEATSPQGELLWQSHSTYLARHKTPTASQRTPTPTPVPGKNWSLPADLGRRYAAVSGDRNPIHLHALTARPFGFPRAIAHGMWTAARCLAEQEGTPTHARVEFKAPVLLPSTVTYSSTTQSGTTGTTTTFELRDAQGRPHLTGATTAPTAALP
ncbi:MaoC/PaaZ C-terminal domain-containing protein [Streptomyces atriruber]|uniref:MaoC/PaaZ C-terminal domain-containing protein n=1 Tax=Streptomyces atriruber TaxID=545121 RepID=A0ABV3C0M4_9ACTN